jgi:hypothetical protein
VQFFYCRSLWLDEAMLALNILEKSPSELMSPLSDNQVAPPLFLLLEKAFSYLPCHEDYSLRLLPLFSFWTALYIFQKLSRTMIPTPSARFAAFCLISLSSVFLYYSNEIKQYMTDAAVSCLLLYLYLQPKQVASRYYTTLIVAGWIAIFLSNAAIIILFSMGITMLWNSRWKSYGNWIMLTGGVWLTAFLIYYSFFIKGHPSKAFMLNYWGNQDAFLPLNLLSEEFIQFAGLQFSNIAGMYMAKLPWISGTLLPILIVAGVLHLVKSHLQSPFFLLLLLPLPVHLLISALKLYPFDARLYLYLIPVLALVMGLGWEYIVTQLPSWKYPELEKVIFLLPIFLLTGIYLKGFPMKRQEHKENLAFYNLHSKKGQGLFISAGSRYPGKYYLSTQFLQVNGPLTISKMKKKNELDSRMNEILCLEGQTWLLFTDNYFDSVKYYTHTLDSLQIPCLESHKAVNSSLFLYDFGNGQDK